jgi:hypothetical protein
MVSYPKNMQPSTPLTRVAAKARCTKCGLKGRCRITETPYASTKLSSGSSI